MTQMVRTTIAATAMAITGQFSLATATQAYQVDCAILLCLAGGWPPSGPCAHAKAEFIRRITPWPIEPPLQIWRCPMGASLEAPRSRGVESPVTSIAFRPEPSRSGPALGDDGLFPARTSERADVDIAGDAFDFVRSIRVFHIRYSQRDSENSGCVRSDATRLGSYGEQGDFSWSASEVSQIPAASALRVSENCYDYSYRSVFVDWRDHGGSYGYEEVRY